MTELDKDGPTLTYGGGTMTIRMPKQVDWLPAEDITAYELALALPTLLSFLSTGSFGWRYPEDDVAMLPVNVRRHFRIHD